MPIKQRKNEMIRSLSSQPALGRLRTGGPKTTPAGTTPQQQRRRTTSPRKWARK